MRLLLDRLGSAPPAAACSEGFGVVAAVVCCVAVAYGEEIDVEELVIRWGFESKQHSLLTHASMMLK